jgi:hypothetical protein
MRSRRLDSSHQCSEKYSKGISRPLTRVPGSGVVTQALTPSYDRVLSYP